MGDQVRRVCGEVFVPSWLQASPPVTREDIDRWMAALGEPVTRDDRQKIADLRKWRDELPVASARKKKDWANSKQKQQIWDAIVARGDKMQCHWCATPLSRQALYYRRLASLDHVVPRSAGGAVLDPANIVIACVPCNSTRSAQSYSPPITERELAQLLAPASPHQT